MKEDNKQDLDQRLIAILQHLDGLNIGQARTMLANAEYALKNSGIVSLQNTSSIKFHENLRSTRER